MTWIRKAAGEWQKRPELNDYLEILRNEDKKLKAVWRMKLGKGDPFQGGRV